MSVPITLTSGIRLESDKVECEATSTSSEFKLSSRCPGFPSLADNPEAMARPKSGSEGTHAPAGTHQGPLWTALSLAVRSVALGGVASLAVVVALVAWLVLRSALAVDPVVARERLWLQYGQYKPPYALVQLDKAKYSTPGKVYDVTLELTVPVNPNNLDLGNFMCSLSLLDATGEHLVTASRPAILAHPSASAQACLAPSSSKHSSTLSRLLLFPLTLVTRSTSTAASCLAPLASSSWTPGPGCTTKLVIPLLERASFASPALSSSALTARKPSRWTLGRGYKARRAASNGPATALWVQVGREDAHPSPDEAKTALKRGEEVEQAEGRTETRVSRRERERERPRELQVQEAWVRIEVQLHGLRAFAYHHPYLLFATFVPSFLALELFAALAAYVLCVVRAEPATPEEQDLVQRLSGRREGAKPRGASPSGRARTPQTELSTPFEFETDVEAEAARLRAARRMRLGPGGVGMSEAFTASGGPSGGETGTGTEYTDEDGEEGTEVGESVSEVGVGEVRGRVKDEEDEGDAGTVAGSATTRATRSTFGPSLGGTTITSSTGTTSALGGAASSAGMRGRAAGGTGAAKEEEE
ncbi:putative adipose-regulatory protein-domain-containing protein [Rhodotorula diobovata]|uniref:Putative adipose-regulatory protein-domain-containing protein n=1 Tax=Rhodotorula diobovata TaxID=5288 RepID=A0A5C5G1V7_9BASI|nr:putative adipose-regulatory protein-domain-containing protein [Rhodotorula diobovata]